MDWIQKIKAIVAMIFGAITAWLGVLAVPVYMLVLCNAIDYGTGIAAAWKRGEQVSSYKGLRGIAKKVCMWMLIAVGAILDWLLLYAGEALKTEVHLPMLAASLTAVWLICNELLSILENVRDMGIPLPGFLEKLVNIVKQSTTEKE